MIRKKHWKVGFETKTLVQVFFSFDVVQLPIFAVKGRCSIFHSNNHILCVPSPFFENVIFLESWLYLVSKNVVISFRFYPMLFLSFFWIFFLYGGYLGCSGSEDHFHGMGSFILGYTIFCINFFPFLIIFDIICKHLYANALR